MIPQSDPAWAAARLGCVSASRIADLTAQTKTGPGASRANYMSELIVERLTGAAAERFVNGAMQWGRDTGQRRAQWYETPYDGGEI